MEQPVSQKSNIRFPTVAVIGGGASGMMAALTAARVPGRRVHLIERQQRVGRKLLATGNGRCNLTNRNAAPGDYSGTDAAFASPALTGFTPEDTLAFFEELGLLTVTEHGGRVYPLSDSANSVLDVLRFALERESVVQHCGAPVEEIRDGTVAGFRSLQFGMNAPETVTLRMATDRPVTVHVRLDRWDGKEIACMQVQAGETETTAPVTGGILGKHAVYFLFRCPETGRTEMDRFTFD